MIILDFLFYYLTYWFEKNRDKLTWSTPIERSSYIIGLATTTFLVAIAEIFAFTIFKNSEFPIPKFIFVGVGLGIMYLYDFLYIKKERFATISEEDKIKTKNPQTGIVITMTILLIAILLPAIIFICFVPFGDQGQLQ
jgi:hypothetical protein